MYSVINQAFILVAWFSVTPKKLCTSGSTVRCTTQLVIKPGDANVNLAIAGWQHPITMHLTQKLNAIRPQLLSIIILWHYEPDTAAYTEMVVAML